MSSQQTSTSFDTLVNLKLLASVKHIGLQTIKQLIDTFGSAEAVLSSTKSALLSVPHIHSGNVDLLLTAIQKRDDYAREMERELNLLDNLQAKLYTIFDVNYPEPLKHIYAPPLFLYIRGSIEEADKESIAIVGTRNFTAYGKKMTYNIAGELAEKGITVISGLARGIDSFAHRAALDAGGRTIAVMATGIDQIYPPEHRKLAHDILQDGAVITEFPPGIKPEKNNFPQRNRIISALSLGTVIIESGMPGGSLITARFALDQGKEVFALPGNVGAKTAEGTNFLIQRGQAKLIQNTDDILMELEHRLEAPAEKRKAPPPQLSFFEEKIYSLLEEEPLHIDVISRKSEIASSECLVTLLNLEFKGLVMQLPGKMFTKM